MAMLVLVIFAVGSVSAEDNVTTDIDVPTEDIAIDDVPVGDVDEGNDASSDANKIVNTRYNSYITTGSSSSVIDAAITTVNSNGGGNVYFTQGDYYNISINMKSNVNLIGNGARLIGTGSSHVINLPNNLNNFTISGFIIDVNNATGKSSAIYGSFITNGVIANNTMFNGANGVNINKYYDNMTVDNNIIYNMNNDGISFANPVSNSNIASLGKTNITNNNISSCTYGIFIGGNFKGNIANNTIHCCTYGMEFAGKPKPGAGNGTLIATLFNNTISCCDYGINMFHPGVQYLNMSYVNFVSTGYDDIITSSNFNKTGFIGVYHCVFTDYSSFESEADDWIDNWPEP
ncbi:MAG: hypothetical protein IJF83_10315 [Methanobrevibacter sp.]|nr:hypothetical protein [Methanobrevibacter sp.]